MAGHNPRIIGIIPARYASSRFPGKMLHPIHGKPLIQYVWEQCQKASRLDNVIVATDDMRIAEAAFNFGAEISLTRPDHQSGTDRIAEVASKLRDATHVVNIQGDEPAIDPRLVNRLCRDLADHPDRRMNTAATPFQNPAETQNPNAVKVVRNRNGDALYFSRLPIPYDRDGDSPATPLLHLGIYGYRIDTLLEFVRLRQGTLERAEKLEQLRALENGIPIRVLQTSLRARGIDTPEDARAFERATHGNQPASITSHSLRPARGRPELR